MRYAVIILLVAASAHSDFVHDRKFLHQCDNKEIIHLPSDYMNYDDIFAPNDDGEGIMPRAWSQRPRRCRAEDELNIAGVWYNEHGSELILCHDNHGLLTGEYRTAVESSPGAAGFERPVVGWTVPRCTRFDASEKWEVPLAFNVVWESYAVMSWVGHYQIAKKATTRCNRVRGCSVLSLYDETLFTSWTMASNATHSDRWAANRMGHNIFKRPNASVQPRRARCKDTPSSTGDIYCPEHIHYEN
ncbi:PREDICTED: uncharacterized protein LOC106816888 [Priapulus caudatus]|uniref:Uncharacterized protein LOC106816888 n=1 Tax=Priapulus caudatus TaxID=37621 RepID=A0ABM1EXU3_PRICU|nr:PREDICTED: uncharacterized protein LOC106816888 [Priapulus caudatus]